jgi:hypothetical protein
MRSPSISMASPHIASHSEQVRKCVWGIRPLAYLRGELTHYRERGELPPEPPHRCATRCAGGALLVGLAQARRLALVPGAVGFHSGPSGRRTYTPRQPDERFLGAMSSSIFAAVRVVALGLAATSVFAQVTDDATVRADPGSPRRGARPARRQRVAPAPVRDR